MNKIDKIIKDLKERNDKLSGQRREFEMRLYNQQYITDKLQQENKQLKENWNKLREWIVYHKHNENAEEHYLVVDYGTLLGKMQKLESGDSNE